MRVQTISVSGDFSGVISNLESSTDYSIKVAAMNSVGIGPYSDDNWIKTHGIVLAGQIKGFIHCVSVL